MQFGERTEIGGQRSAGACFFSWLDITIHLFPGAGFGTFRDGFPGASAVSCMLDRGGMSA